MRIAVLHLLKSEDGATAIEYGLTAALFALAVVNAWRLVGSNLSRTFTTVASNL